MLAYDINVIYKGVRYSTQSDLYLNHFSRSVNIDIPENEISDNNNFKVPTHIFAKYDKADSIVKLSFGHILFCKETIEEPFSERYFFEEKSIDSMSYNLETGEGTCYLDILDKLTKEKPGIYLEPDSIKEILLYIQEIVSKNERVFNYLKTKITSLSNTRFGSTNITKTSLMYIVNLSRLVTTNLLEIEKVISSENDFILKSVLNRDKGVLEKGKKLAKVINIPKFALDYIKEKDLIEAEESVRNICTDFDGNDLKIIFDFFDSFDTFHNVVKLSKYDRGKIPLRRKNILNYCYFLMKREYKIVTLLNYVLRQRLYWNDDSRKFDEPFEELKLLVDYVTLNEEKGFSYEKYPQDLERSHDISVKNFKELGNNDKNSAFIQAIKDNYYTDPIIIDDFVFTVPKDINDLVAEGNNLHHCIGSYTDNIIENCSHIYFMRFKSSPNESYVTLELDPKTKDLVESKENYNKEVSSDEAIKALKKFEKQMKASLKSKATPKKEEEK